MPLRGSVQLLLLSLRQRGTRKAWLGAVGAVGLVVGGVQLASVLPSLGEDGLAQALRQSVWNQVLADQSTPARWPWEDLSVSMSLAPSGSVPRLGLSAAMRRETAGVAESVLPAPDRAARAETRKAKSDQVQGDVALSDVTIGDSITFTAADGAICVYQVTGRRVIDPHLAASEAERFGGEAAQFQCGPLEKLIMQATQGEPDAAPKPAEEQRKL
ncbi:hypothetical protein [Methyloceanibacter marginalis]|uniref:hypothetical protein n=1 Tax=Methyloceanibacter marginalis TaxID=1774971 RepID=UPI00114D0DCC|nr:hypothetical protein [Methyloceanibacter marginalis]